MSKGEIPKYRLTETFYDNLVLWEIGEEIDWEGSPAPSMIPLNQAAVERMQAYMKERGVTDYVPPLSELPDSMDGRTTVAAFNPGDRRGNNVKGPAKNPFPKTPGKEGSRYKGARRSEEVEAEPIVIPTKAPKNFDRTPQNR